VWGVFWSRRSRGRSAAAADDYRKDERAEYECLHARGHVQPACRRHTGWNSCVPQPFKAV